jgi:hypothetical protein
MPARKQTSSRSRRPAARRPSAGSKTGARKKKVVARASRAKAAAPSVRSKKTARAPKSASRPASHATGSARLAPPRSF